MSPLIIILGLIILVFSAILHEVAHGWVADRLGDPTARLAGRLTLNPLPHIDPIYTILLPLLLYVLPPHIAIGGAKPVPIDEFNLKDGRRDVALVSLAGPGTNILIAIFSALILHSIYFIFQSNSNLLFIKDILANIIAINLYLAIFNLLPIPPLDGSKIFSLILPDETAKIYLSIGSIGIFIILFLFTFPIGSFSLQNLIFNIFTFARGLLGI